MGPGRAGKGDPAAPNENFDMTDVNILAELYMQLGSFTETHALITRARQAIKQLQQEETCGEPGQDAQEEALPIDLAVKDGLCLAHLGRLEEADAMLAGLRADEEVTSLYPDLTLDVGCALATMGQHARALDYLCRLLVVPEFGSDQALWARLLTCHRALGNMEPMVTLYKSRLEEMAKDDLSYLETATTLAELYIECGRTEEALAFMPKLDESILKLQQGAAANAAAAAATSRSLDEQHKQARAQAEAEGKAGPDNKWLDQRPQFIQAVLPLVQDALESLAADSAAMKNPSLPRELARAISRRRMLESKGRGASRANLLEGEESTVFQGKPVRKDRRKAHVREADEMADAYFAGLGLTDVGSESAAGSTSAAAAAGLQGDGTGGRSELQRAVSRFRMHRAAALRALFTDEEGLHTFTELLSALVAEGQAQEAADLSRRAMELCGGQSRWFPRARRDVVTLILDAVMHVKAVLGRWPASCRVWSRFSRAVAALGPLGTRSWSFVINSARRRCPESVPAMIMQGHAHAFHGKFNEALSEYFQAYRFWPDEPLLLLSIGVAFIRLACSEKVADRNRAVLQGFAFLQAYSHQRGSKLLHESLYNIGRAAHALGLAGIAHHFYITCLASSRPSPDANQEGEAAGVNAMQLHGTARVQHLHQQQHQQQHGRQPQGAVTFGTDVEMAEVGESAKHTRDAGSASVDAEGPHSCQVEPNQAPHSPAPSRGSGGTQASAAAAAASAAATHQGGDGMQAGSVAAAHQAGIPGSGSSPEPGGSGGGQQRQPPGLWRRRKMRYTVTAGQGVAVTRGMGPGEGGSTALGVGNMLDDVPGSLDLSQETAHNLAIMYRASGATALVHRLYRRFLTIT
ncbi:hypothetical protein DUNSADRAFT_14445 [Dunaliella salina]|uniref:General transcription factor 3C polypeptide 3 n=1 Tax=Dunaliella salina TaxID=3046 RepID=A0ABQ7H9K7_DUNSA|nr:hypothetical protein DUNSADRAFT_14445 [Dunaliella salina]|eukprot:KAF5843529.1 hypothetical protein DUNSADRAFT_14445 [Dunaliella salina]